MDRQALIRHVLAECSFNPVLDKASAFAPANIALCKYWGKRNDDLHLASNPSLSISLGHLGATTQIALSDTGSDSFRVNDQWIDASTPFAQRLSGFLDYFRTDAASSNTFLRMGTRGVDAREWQSSNTGMYVPECHSEKGIRQTTRRHFVVETHSTIPIAAGLASSAAGFAALVQALDKLFAWNLPLSTLAVLARLGSGSATRSLWQGFVEWPMGTREDGMDSVGQPLEAYWPDLRIGLLMVDAGPKTLSSRTAMQQTVLTSPFYQIWTHAQSKALLDIKAAIHNHDFESLGLLTEGNALGLHALMLSAHPPILYSQPETIRAIHQIWAYRKEGLQVFFTQDAGPNLKLLFLHKDLERMQACFRGLIVVDPFSGCKYSDIFPSPLAGEGAPKGRVRGHQV